MAKPYVRPDGLTRRCIMAPVGPPKAPSTNIQAPEKLQEPSFKTRALRVWSLQFGASPLLGAWMLVLFAPPYSTVFVEETRMTHGFMVSREPSFSGSSPGPCGCC